MAGKMRLKIVKAGIDLSEKVFFERRLKRVYAKIFAGKIQSVMDVGANKGQTISFFLKINPGCKIYAFEPNRTLFGELVNKYGANRNIILVNAGVSEAKGKKKFFENVLDYTSSFEELNYDSEYLKKKSKILGVDPGKIVKDTYEVETVVLSDFVNEKVSETVDILKIDVEGHEYACLKGLFAVPVIRQIHYIQFEYHDDDMYRNKISFNDIDQLLKDNGYLHFETVKHGFGKIVDVIYKLQKTK